MNHHLKVKCNLVARWILLFTSLLGLITYLLIGLTNSWHDIRYELLEVPIVITIFLAFAVFLSLGGAWALLTPIGLTFCSFVSDWP